MAIDWTIFSRMAPISCFVRTFVPHEFRTWQFRREEYVPWNGHAPLEPVEKLRRGEFPQFVLCDPNRRQRRREKSG